MTVTKKTVRLHYTLEKEGKETSRSYAYDIALDVDKQKAKEFADLLSPLFKEDIETATIQTTEKL